MWHGKPSKRDSFIVLFCFFVVVAIFDYGGSCPSCSMNTSYLYKILHVTITPANFHLLILQTDKVKILVQPGNKTDFKDQDHKKMATSLKRRHRDSTWMRSKPTTVLISACQLDCLAATSSKTGWGNKGNHFFFITTGVHVYWEKLQSAFCLLHQTGRLTRWAADAAGKNITHKKAESLLIRI